MASIGELFIQLGIKADTVKLNKVSEGISNLRKNSLLLVASFAGAGAGVERFVDGTLKGVVALQNLNAQTGLSIDKLQQFQQAGQLSNLSLNAEQIAQSIGNVQKNLAQIKIGQGNIAPFQLLGIDVGGQDAFGVIDQLRDSIKGVDAATATNLISQIGLTPDFINLLKISRKEFEALSENTFLNKRQRADIDKVGTSIKALTLRFKALKDQAVAKIAPELNILVQQFFKWLKDNGDKIINVISGIAIGFSKFAKAIGNSFSLVTKFLDGITGMENGIKILATAFGFLTLSFSPFLAGLAAVILLLDDVAVYRAGGDSLIGDLINSFKELPDLAKILTGGVGIVALTKLSGVFTLLAKSISGLRVAAGSVPATAFLSATAFLAAATFLANAPNIGRKVADIIENAKSGQGGVSGFFQDWAVAIRDSFGESEAETFARIGVNPALSGGATTINNNININGVQDPQLIKSELQRSITPLTQESLNRVQVSQNRITK